MVRHMRRCMCFHPKHAGWPLLGVHVFCKALFKCCFCFFLNKTKQNVVISCLWGSSEVTLFITVGARILIGLVPSWKRKQKPQNVSLIFFYLVLFWGEEYSQYPHPDLFFQNKVRDIARWCSVCPVEEVENTQKLMLPGPPESPL